MKTKPLIINIGMLCLYPIAAMGQIPEPLSSFRCYTETVNEELKIMTPEDYLAFYTSCIPYEGDAVKVIPVNWIFLQKDDGTGGFQADNAEHQQYWNIIEERVNYLFSNLKETDNAACYAWKDPFLSDTKIRFSFNRFYIRDSYAWNRRNQDERHRVGLEYMEYLREDIENDSSIPEGINVFFTADEYWYDYYTDALERGDIIHFDSTGRFGASFASYIHIADAYIKYLWMRYMLPSVYGQSWESTIIDWWTGSLAILIAHELGHALGLHHHCDHYKEKECAESLMNPVGNGGHDYLPPSEIGRMHYTTMASRFLSSIIPAENRKFTTLTLDREYNSIGYRLYSDLVIAPDGRIILLGEKVIVPPRCYYHRGRIPASEAFYHTHIESVCFMAGYQGQRRWCPRFGRDGFYRL